MSHALCLTKVGLNLGTTRNFRWSSASLVGGFIPHPCMFVVLLSETQGMLVNLFKIAFIQGPFQSVAIRTTDSAIEQFPGVPKNWHIILGRMCLLFNTFQIIF